MNPLGVIADETSHTIRGCLDWIADGHDVDGVELRKVEGKHVHELSPQKLGAIRRQVSNADKEIHAIASPMGKAWLDDDKEFTEHVAMAQPLVEAANILGTKRIRIFGGKRKLDTTAGFDRTLEFFRAVLAFIPNDITLVVENEPATMLATLGDVACLHSALGGDMRIEALFDPGNYFFDTTLVRVFAVINKPIEYLIDDEIEAHHPIISLVHIKNLVLDKTDMKGLTVGLNVGDLNFNHIIGTLMRCCPDVPFDLEPHRTETGQLSEADRHGPGDPGYAKPENAAHDLHVLRGITEALKNSD